MENTYDISQILLPNGDICKIKNTTGNAATATAFSANKTVELTGDVTGSASSTGGWSIATTIGSGKVTNNMLAGSIANGKLSNSYIKINNKTINLGDTVSLADLGLSNVLNFAGTTTTAMSDNLTTATVIINGNSYTPNSGDVVIYSDAEYLWTGSQWELLGNESSYALDSDVIKKSFMNAKGDLITASGDDTPTILTIGSAGQVLTVDSGAPAWKTLPSASTSGAGIVQLSSSTSGSSETKAATEKAVKTTYNAAILKSVGTTKGDIIYWTDNATIERLSRGNDGTFLKMASNLPSWATLSATDIPNLSATKITSDTFDAARIPNLNASKITAGTFDVARIPNLPASKITSGTFEVARGGTGLNTITANQILIGGSNDDTITQIGVTNPGNTDTFTSYISAVPNTPSDNLIVNLKTLKLAIPPMNKNNPIDTTSSSYEPAYYAPTSKGKIHSVLIAQGEDNNSTGTEPLWLDPSNLAGENDNGHGGALFYGRDMSSAATTKPFKTQWGTLPVEQGGTGVTNFTNNIDKVLITAIDNGIQYFSTITKTAASEPNTLVLRNSNGNFAANIITLSSGINTPKPGGLNNVITIENTIPTHYGNLEADNLTATIGTIEMSKISSNVPSDLPIINWYKSILDTKTKIGSIYWTIDTSNNGQASFTNISSEGKIETYQLPAATSTTDTTYKILTTKNTLNGALYVSTDGADPSWGTLPITQGGTGVTTLSDLFNEIKGTGSDGFGDATWVNVTGDTITGQLILNKVTALTSGATSDGALIIGTATNVHLAFDTDSIMAKNNTAVSTLFINEFGGNVNILKASDANYSVNIRSTKSSTSYSTGALVVSGGLGIGGAIYGGSSIYAPSGSFYAGTTSVNNEKIIKVSTNSGEMYMYSAGNTDGNGNRGIYLPAHGIGAAKNVFTVDTNNNINFYGNLTGNVTGNLTGNASTASLLKPIASTTTESASTWNIPDGSKQVWGERFSDTTLKYTNSNDEQVTVTDTGDWTIWLTPSANSNTATLSMRIDGTYYGTFEGNITGDISGAFLLPSISSDDTAMPDSIGPAFKVYKLTGSSNTIGNNGNLISMTWDKSTHYGAQIFVDTDPTYNISLRQRDSSGVWNTWKRIPMGDGTGASGTWEINISGNAATATKFASSQSITLTGDTTGTVSSQAGWSITTKTDRLSTVGDNRAVATTPNDYNNKIIFQGLKTNSYINNPSTDTYSYVIGLRGWGDSSGGKAHEFAFNDSGINHRIGSTTSWESWEKIITSGNYTNYAVAKSGDIMTGVLTVPAIELGNQVSGHGGYIDFHYNGSTTDFTTRLIENSSGNLLLSGSLTIQSNGLWVQGGSEAGSNNSRMGLSGGMPDAFPYGTSKRGVKIYSNAIAFADPYNGNGNNDAGWIRHLEETGNSGILEFGVGDDGDESIVARQYNTSSSIVRTFTLLDASGNTTIPGLLNNFKINTTTSLDANDLSATNGLWIVASSIGNAAGINHGTIFSMASVGTPSEFYIPDSTDLYIYKRWYSDSWSSWSKISAGYSDSAGNADTVDSYHASSLWRSDGAIWNVNANVTCSGDGEWSFDVADTSSTGSSFWHVWSTNLGNSMLRCYPSNGHVTIPYHLAVGYDDGNYSLSATNIHTSSTIVSGGSPSFEASTAAGSWAYLRLNNGSYIWDIASNSSASSNHLEFRGGGGDTNKLRFTTDGRLEIYNQQSANNSIMINSSGGESTIAYKDKSNQYTTWTVGRGPGSIGSSFGWWNGSSNVMTLTNTGTLTTSGSLYVSQSNATGGGIFLADDGSIVDNNDGYCSMRFSYGVRICAGNNTNGSRVQLRNTGVIDLWPQVGNWSEGMRIHPYNGWSTICLCSSDNSGDAGTTSNTWSIHNNEGNFYLAKGGSNSGGTARLACNGTEWTFYIVRSGVEHSISLVFGSVNFGIKVDGNFLCFRANGTNYFPNN